MNRLVVLDTNVLVSAAINASGTPAKVLELVLSGELVLLTCPTIIEEYLTVMSRPKFKKLGLPPLWLEFLIRQSHHVAQTPSMNGIAWTDSDDAIFYELAAQFGAVLVSGNLKHFPADNLAGVRVMSPAKFIEALEN